MTQKKFNKYYLQKQVKDLVKILLNIKDLNVKNYMINIIKIKIIKLIMMK